MGATYVNLGGSTKAKLFKVGSISMNFGYDNSASARTKTLNISSVYPKYKELTVDDICFPLTYSRAWTENYPDSGTSSTLSSFKKTYDPSTGVITITANGSYNYNNTQFTCDIYVLDRFNTSGGKAAMALNEGVIVV